MPRAPDDRDRAILSALVPGSLATPALSQKLGEDPGVVRARCQRLEEAGFVTSTLAESERRLFYFPPTEEVLTAENHDRIMRRVGKEPDAVLRPFHPKVRIWELTGAGGLPGESMLPPPPKKKKAAGASSASPDEDKKRRRRR